MTTGTATPICSTGLHAGSACVLLADVAAELNLHPAKLYAAALKTKVPLVRIGRHLAGERWALDAAAATCTEAPE